MTNLYPTIIVLLQLVVSILQGSHGKLTQDQISLLSQAVQLCQSATVAPKMPVEQPFSFIQPVLPSGNDYDRLSHILGN